MGNRAALPPPATLTDLYLAAMLDELRELRGDLRRVEIAVAQQSPPAKRRT